MKKTAFILIILTIVSKILGFTREITLSFFYGASSISDAYLIALTIPSTIFTFIATGITTSYIPMYSSIEKEKGILEADNFTNNLISLVTMLSTIIVILVCLFPEGIIKLFASGFEGEILRTTATFTKISVVGIYFSGLIFIYTAYLQLKNQFISSALSSIPLHLFTIMSIIFSHNIGVIILPIGTVVALIMKLAFLIPFIKKNRYKYKFSINWSDKYLKNLIFLSIPVIIGISVNQINTLIDRTIASQLATGAISALNYANRLNLFVQGIFVMSLATVMYPMISKMVSKNNMKGLKESISEAINGIALLVIPTTIGSMLFAKPIVTLLFGRGAFDNNAISMTSSALFFYSIGMIGFGFREILSRVFYSMQNTKTPMINAAIGMIFNIILNIILSKYLGIGGLALATSIAAILTTILMFISLRKKIGPFGMKKMSISFMKILLASLIMGLLAKLSFNYLIVTLSQNLTLLIAITIGVISYFVIIYFMKIEDVDMIINAVKKKLGQKGANNI